MKGQKNKIIKILLIIGGLGLIFAVYYFLFYNTNNSKENTEIKYMGNQGEIILSSPKETSETSIEEALLKRRSVRNYKNEPLALKEISQILWAAQGITNLELGGRTAPSAGALYPLEIYLVVRLGEEIKPGIYRYVPKDHKLIMVSEGNFSKQLAEAALGQMFINNASANLIFSGVFSRTAEKYGERGIKYVYMEAGHAAQNVYLQAESLGLGTVVVGAFNDKEIRQILKMPADETPLYIMPIGKI